MVEFEEGRIIGSTYRVVRGIGQGGMGRVYEVEHVRLGTHFALKVFASEGANAEFLRKRFMAEGRILSRIVHPRIVRVHDMDSTEGRVWFTMDYVVGPSGQPVTLADIPQAGGTSESRLWSLFADVAEALTVIHAAGIVHRDIALTNVLLDREGRGVLSDFGISRIMDDKFRQELSVTRTMSSKDADLQLVLGTPAYLAPELKRGGEPTHASDLYALGVMFYRLLTGIWYEPGSHAFDLLAPFDKRWRSVLAGLLAADPTARRLVLPNPAPVARKRWWMLLALAMGLACAFAAGVVLGLKHGRVHAAQDCSAALSDDVAEDFFSIPAGVE